MRAPDLCTRGDQVSDESEPLTFRTRKMGRTPLKDVHSNCMYQLTQTLKEGDMRVLEVPFPALADGVVLVRNHYSVISAGTEGKTVKDARLGYISKARTRQKEVQQVIGSVKTNGFRTTYSMVMNKLEAPAPLGYSCAGEVLAVGRGVTGFKVGDRVACGGTSANHAEVVAVPKNLCAKVPAGVDMRHAALTTIATIAMQGVRQADLGLGANCVVIGLGLVGLSTVQLLEAAGVQTIGVDIDADHVALARSAGATLALERGAPGLEDTVLEFTRGAGTDAVIITAGTSSLDPVELAGRLCRKRGRVVVVGAVPTGFSREHYYKKELDLRMSCSYGPGRYDALYEEHGVDYPIGYVRWTENRNMQAYLDLLSRGKLNPDPLITHVFPLEQAPEAYGMILDRAEPFVGILLEYDVERSMKERVETVSTRQPARADVSIGFVGAGSFAQNVLLPIVKDHGTLVGVATARPPNARGIADKYGFGYCTGDADEIVTDERISTVFVVTRHDLHAPYVLQALRNDKHVFVEKPLCMCPDELDEIRDEYEMRDVHLMVGFNRRFAPLVQRLKAGLPQGLPRAISYRINAGTVPADHWIHDKRHGGGRIIGEVCHFVDLARHLAGSTITNVAANAMSDPHELQDTLTVSLGFENGSTASIAYFSNGNKSLRKEYLEVFCGGQVAILDDFRRLTVYADRVSSVKSRNQDKGHREEITRFLHAVRTGAPAPIPFGEIYDSTRATLKILESIQTRETVEI